MIQLKVGPRQSVSYAKESKELLDPRRRRIVELRESGKTFREIGEALGVSRSYAQSLYSRAVRRMLRSGDPLAALSQRARNCLAREGLETREQVIAVIARGLLHPSATRFTDRKRMPRFVIGPECEVTDRLFIIDKK